MFGSGIAKEAGQARGQTGPPAERVTVLPHPVCEWPPGLTGSLDLGSLRKTVAAEQAAVGEGEGLVDRDITLWGQQCPQQGPAQPQAAAEHLVASAQGACDSGRMLVA